MMKKLLFVVLILLIQPYGEAIGQLSQADSLNMAEREYFYRKYRSVRDTMRINTWLNLKRVTDNLEQVVKRDQQVIDALNTRISADSIVISDLNEMADSFHELQIKSEDLNIQAKKNDNVILYLKVAAAALFLLLLLVIVFLVSSIRNMRKGRYELDRTTNSFDESQHQLETLDTELRKLKQREADFREELERGMESNQARLLSLQEKCALLEKENHQLRSTSESGSGIHLPVANEMVSRLELSENPDELKQMVKSLFDERNSLINLAGKLRIQAEAENKKNQEIISRINSLVNDLSGAKGN